MALAHPDCPYKHEDCRIVISNQTTTTLTWPTMVFNGLGEEVQSLHNPNTTTAHYVCLTCKGVWDTKRQDGYPDHTETRFAPQPKKWR